MNQTSTTTALPRRPATLMRAALGAVFILGTLSAQSSPQQLAPLQMPTAQADPGQSPGKAGEEAKEICFTSWYLRINEYLFEGREFKRFIAASPAQGDRQTA